jgi:Ca2+/Na+ antiporter
MKVWKLVSGILSCILFALVTFQSCAAGIANTLEDNGEVSGSAGILVAVLMLAGGIISIATRKSKKNGGNIALIVLFGLAALMGFANYGSYSDLAIWSGWCLINAVLAVVAILLNRKNKNEPTTQNAA